MNIQILKRKTFKYEIEHLFLQIMVKHGILEVMQVDYKSQVIHNNLFFDR